MSIAIDNDWRLWTYSLSFVIVKLEQLEAAVVLQRPVQIPHVFVHLGDHGVVGQTLTTSHSGDIIHQIHATTSS